ncbi:MAG: ribulose-phosphate 3-epimerase [Oligoflexia bacterium]|nr:ribulose-phosphate 3-epimerase [Oligoflexia bacterium]
MAADVLIAPSILSCDFARLGEEILKAEAAGADWVHVDVMDGHFVDNLTIGPPVIACIKKVASRPLDVHLMIERPELSIERYVKAGADYLTIHVEATKDPTQVLKNIRSFGAKPGITLRPGTPLNEIIKYLEHVDLVLVMTVNPGWGGQAFMPEQLEKVKTLKAWADKNNPKLFIEVDGGINATTAPQARAAGANVFVAGNAVFKTDDYKKAIESLRG